MGDEIAQYPNSESLNSEFSIHKDDFNQFVHYVENSFMDKLLDDKTSQDHETSSAAESCRQELGCDEVNEALNPSWLNYSYQYVSDGLKRGCDTVGFVFVAFRHLLVWVWTSQVFWLPRLIIGNTFRARLVFFLGAFLWNRIRTTVYDAYPSLSYFGPSHELYTMSTAGVPPNETVLPQLQFFANATNRGPIIVDNFIHINNLTVNSLVLHQVLQLITNELVVSKAIVYASHFPLKQEIIVEYNRLLYQMDEIANGSEIFAQDVRYEIFRIKYQILDTFDVLDKVILDPNLAKPISPDPIVQGFKFFLDEAAYYCKFMFFWDYPSSLIFCATAFGLNAFLNHEILCWQFGKLPIQEPQGCLHLLGPALKPEAAILRKRRETFEVVWSEIKSLFVNLERSLTLLEKSIAKQRIMVQASTETRENIVMMTEDSRATVYRTSRIIEAEHYEALHRWNTRPLLTRLVDWLASKAAPLKDVSKLIRLESTSKPFGASNLLTDDTTGQTQDLRTLNTLQGHINTNLDQVMTAIRASQANIKEANQRLDLFSEHLIQGFCLQYGGYIADRDCGSNNDFLIRVNSIIVVFSELIPLLERIESGLIAQE